MVSSLGSNETARSPRGEAILSILSGAERRRGVRLRQARPIKVFEPTLCRYIGGQTQDVSATGLRITLPASSPLRQGGLLNIHVGVSEGGQPLANRRDMMPARVVWIDRRSDPSRQSLCAGVELTASIAANRDAA